MNKIWNIKDIRNVLNKISVEMNFPCDHVEIELSTRMTKTLGKFVFIKQENIVHPIRFVFSTKLLDGRYVHTVVKETIIHEYVHFYCTIKFQQNCGHNKIFKYYCNKAGIKGDTYFSAKPTVYVPCTPKKHYIIKCKKCGTVVAIRQRKNAVTTLIIKYKSKCCKSKLEYSERFLSW